MQMRLMLRRALRPRTVALGCALLFIASFAFGFGPDPAVRRGSVAATTTEKHDAKLRPARDSYYSSEPVVKVMQEARQSHAANAIHIALVYTADRADQVAQTIRSIVYFTRSRPVVFHALTSEDGVQALEDLVDGYPFVAYYDISICRQAIRPLLPFTPPHFHWSVQCRGLLASLLPTTVERVMFIDNDITATQDISKCFDADFDEHQMVGMVRDMGDACVLDPSRCWPIGFKARVQEGLVCGGIPREGTTPPPPGTLMKQQPYPVLCPSAGQYEPAQLNGGVIVQDLRKMRERGYVDQYISDVIRTARTLGTEFYAWADQDYLNNHFRLHPEQLRILPCGCNYQYAGIRRHVVCPGQETFLGHGWHIGIKDRTKNPYNMLFYYFLDTKVHYLPSLNTAGAALFEEPANVPKSPKLSDVWPGFEKLQVMPMEHMGTACPFQQQWLRCRRPSQLPVRYKDPIFVLTRTAHREAFFRDSRLSLDRQTHPDIYHIVGTDNPESFDYIKNLPAENTVVTKFVSRFHEYDPKEPCWRCGRNPERKCADIPSLDKPVERAIALQCFCNTSFPMNAYMNDLHNIVRDIVAQRYPRTGGWVLYLDDDNLLVSPTSLGELIAYATSTYDMLVFRSMLGRKTPTEEHFANRQILAGDMDTSNFMFHTDHLDRTAWGTQRCGDFRSASSLSQYLEPVWINRTFIAANPLRSALGGNGQREDASDLKLTVIITSYETEGFRPGWVQQSIETYASVEYDIIVDKVIVVWNNVDVPPPDRILAAAKRSNRVVVLPQTKNSLNNRWINTLPYIKTEAVLNLDDDIFIKRDALMCMFSWWTNFPDRFVAPFVRQTNGTNYVMSELLGGEEYTIALPRAIMLSRQWLVEYANPKHAETHKYIDEDEAHCDDLFLNMFATRHLLNRTGPFLGKGNLPKDYVVPYRVIVPDQSILDYYSSCFRQFPKETAGLALQKDRTKKRSECLKKLMADSQLTSMPRTKQVGTCAILGRRDSFKPNGANMTFTKMADPHFHCG